MTDEATKVVARAILAEMFADMPKHDRRSEERNTGDWKLALRYAQAAEKARPVGEVPEGWVLVPRKPDVAMTTAMRAAAQKVSARKDRDSVGALAWNGLFLWDAGISAAPSPPEGLGNKGFMADREVEKPTPVASDATPVRLAEFFRWAARASWDAHDLGGDDIQDKALSLGLFKVEPYDLDRHGSSDGMVDPGEDWYTLADDVRAILSDGSLESQEKAPETTLSEINNDPT